MYRLLKILSFALLIALLTASISFAENNTIVVSLDSDGNQIPLPSSADGLISDMTPDGRFVVFSSNSPGVVADDSSINFDVFIRDLNAGTTELISRDNDGIPLSYHSTNPTISADGRYVAFQYRKTGRAKKIQVRDRLLGTTTDVADTIDIPTAAGYWGRDGFAFPVISEDASVVAFLSWRDHWMAANMVYDMTTGSRFILPIAPGYGHVRDHRRAAVSANGRYFAFIAETVEPVHDTVQRVYLYDHETQETRMISINADGSSGFTSDYMDPNAIDISADGRYVVFPMNYGWGSDPVKYRSTYVVYDAFTNTTEPVAYRKDGTPILHNARLTECFISQDGEYITISAADPDLFPPDLPHVLYNARLTFRIHRTSHVSELVSLTYDGKVPYGEAGPDGISSDGRYVMFTSKANNIVQNDTDDMHTIFVRDMTGLPQSLEDLIDYLYQLHEQGLIVNQGRLNSMVSKLENAVKARNRGNSGAASNILIAFTNEVKAQAGKGIDAEAAVRLIEIAGVL